MRHLLTLLIAPALVLGSAQLAAAQARTFEIRNDGESRITFTSDAPLETITGVSRQVTGSVSVDPQSISGASGNVAVRVASIRTGVELRDEHLRADNWLDAAQFPNSTLEITSVEGASALRPNERTRVRIRGRFSLHGVTRNIVASARVRYVPASGEGRDVIHARATFRLQLEDFNVSVPLPVRLKVANEIQVNVTIRAIATSQGS